MDTSDSDFRPVDPFGFWPRKASALIERVDTDDLDSSLYAFHTPYILQGANRFEFRGTLANLEARQGALILRINELDESEHARAVCVLTETVLLRTISDNGGMFRVECEGKPGHRYALLADLSENGGAQARELSIQVSSSAASTHYRQRLIEARQTVFDKAPMFAGLYRLERGAPTLAEPVSQSCTVSQFDEPVYEQWLAALRRPMHRHRKQWEFVYILQSLHHHGKLAKGMRGVGFGVGEEPLPALMAAMGCDVVATDLPLDDERVGDWSGNGQHSSSLDGLRFPEIVPDIVLESRVAFRPVDMTRIPDDMNGFDFTWSSCALEHVGSIAAGLDFIERSIDCIKPGGIAVHTTELNLLSNDRTLDHEGTVLFRRRDFEEIAARLILAGHEVSPLNFTTGSTPMDDHIDMPPYSSNNHFKLVLSRYLTTSFGIIVRKGSQVPDNSRV